MVMAAVVVVYAGVEWMCVGDGVVVVHGWWSELLRQGELAGQSSVVENLRRAQRPDGSGTCVLLLAAGRWPLLMTAHATHPANTSATDKVVGGGALICGGHWRKQSAAHVWSY